ncbi:MAG TPA: 50S ribosomal protein L35 [Phycisphaerales bacterium]|nr:50S ribosomal protein L35 [Phycisphaerales bacterium]HMP38391.1 50S ribosomal protein L35 [Phycisphaerales bacterium]
MPKHKSHKGLLKRIKVTKSGKVRFKPPNSRHLKSNKTGIQVQSYRRNGYARRGMIGRLQLMLQRPLKSQEQHLAERAAKEAALEAAAEAVAA